MKKVFYLLFLTAFLLLSTLLNAQWVKSVGGSDIELGYDIAVDASGNIYVLGYFQGTNADFDPGAGNAYLSSPSSSKWAAFLAKYDSNGDFLWVDGISSDFDVFASGLALDGTSNVYITGRFNGTADFDPSGNTYELTASGTSTYIAKYAASDGSFVWADLITSTSTVNGINLAVDGSGNVYAAGYFQGTADFDPNGTHNIAGAGNYDIFVARYAAADGSLDWVNGMGSSGEDRGNGIAVDGSGNLFLAGWIGGTVDFDPGAGVNNLTLVGSKDAYIAKFSTSDGSLGWVKGLSGSSSIAFAYNLTIDGSSNIYITGIFTGTISFDPNGSSGDLTAQGSKENIFLAKYGSDGTYVWADGIGGSSGLGYGYDVAVDASSNVYITGYYKDIVDFDPGAGTTSKTSISSSDDIFLAGYASTGSLNWINSFGTSSSNEYGYGITTSGSYIYFTGLFTGTIDFDPSGITDNHTASSYDVVFGKYNSSNGLLPVELTSFTASLSDEKVVLNWQTATEVNNYGFDIQRSVISDQQSEWETIGFVEGHGNSNSPKSYEFVDDLSIVTKTTLSGNLEYRLKQIDTDGQFTYYSQTAKVDIQITDVDNNEDIPSEFALEQNYPNPFNPETVISYQLAVNSKVQLEVYDMLGQKVATLVNKQQAPGNYSVNFDASKLTSGIYIYRINAGKYTQSRKMLLLR